MTSPATYLAVVWMIWLACWLLASRWTARTAAEQSAVSRLGHALPIWTGALLLFQERSGLGFLARSLFPPALWLAWLGVAVAAAGLGFAGWARTHLGRFWSSAVTLKADHTLIRSGPYSLSRHPIYTGLLLALMGTALARDSIAGLIGLALLFSGVVVKIRQEERLLGEHFGDAYRAYQAEVPALVSGLW